MAEGKGRTHKRPVLDEADLCIVRQKDTKQKLMKVSRDILECVDTVRQLRLKLRCDNFRDTTDWLTVIFQADTQQLFSWHKDCRSNYISKSNIERLRMTGREGMTGQISSPSTSMSSQQNVSLRSKAPQIDWNQCIFCQQKKKASFHLIQEMNVSKRILEAAQYYQFLKVRIACMNDLTAADGKYHRNCLTEFGRSSEHMENISLTSPDIVLAWLCQELEHAAEKADILDLVDVWARFCDIVYRYIPSSFQTGRNTFKEKLADRLKGIYEIIVLHDQPRTEPRTVLVPSKFRHIPVSEMVNDEANDTERLIPSFKHHDQDTFLPSWTLYNQKASTVNPEKTTVGYLPIIQAPASDLDTLNTVVQRVLHVAKSMDQQHIVLTVDEALYPKLLELKWSVEEYRDVLIHCLGGLHISINYMGVIGRHMSDSGLRELWVECDNLGANAAQNVMGAKGMHVQSGYTNSASSLAIATPMTPCIPGRYWSNVESWIVTSKHCHRRLSHCTHGWETDFWQISTGHERVCWRPNSWWPDSRILMGLHDYGQYSTLLHQSTAWWFVGSAPVRIQTDATFLFQVWSYQLCQIG